MREYVERPNLCLIGVPECDGENEFKLENTPQDIIQENFPNLEGRPIFECRKYREHHKDIPQEEPMHIIVRFTRVGMKEKKAKRGQRERSGYPQREAHQTHSRSLSRNSTSQKRVGANIQHP